MSQTRAPVNGKQGKARKSRSEQRRARKSASSDEPREPITNKPDPLLMPELEPEPAHPHPEAKDDPAPLARPLGPEQPMHRYVFALAGVPGAGKQTISPFLQSLVVEACKKQSLTCRVLECGTTKYYCDPSHGIRPVGKEVSKAVGQELRCFRDNVTTGEVVDVAVLILNTCGELMDSTTTSFFEVDFTGWKVCRMMVNFNPRSVEDYLAWAMMNLIVRGKRHPAATYNLNPGDDSIDVCAKVFNKKALKLTGSQLRVPQGVQKQWLVKEYQLPAKRYAARLLPFEEEASKHLRAAMPELFP